MILNTVLDALAAAVDNITGLRTYAYPADQVSPPAAVIGLPEVPYDATFGGADEWEVPIFVVVGKVSDRASRTALCSYVTPTGATSIKAAVEADKTLGGACDSVAVTRAEFTTISVAGTEFLGAELTCSVVG